MTTALLDVSVLVAMLWPEHESYEKVQLWFERHSSRGWATCPQTQASFVRLVSNPSFSASAVSVEEATKLLAENLDHPAHQYWPADVNYFAAIEPFANRIVGHRQVADAYLLGLAIRHRGTLLTMDRGILELLPARLRQRGLVTLL